MMTVRCRGFSVKTGFAVVLLAAIGSVLFVSLRVRGLRKIQLRYRHQNRLHVFGGSAKKANVHVHKFDMGGNDIMVFLHIQKTGGTKFGIQLVSNLDIERPCQSSRPKRSQNLETEFTKSKVNKRKRVWHCFRPGSSNIWLFSRHHLGWPCGLHADWTEHKECVPRYMNKREGRNNQRKFFYVTIVREPVSRFLSEFNFVVKNNSTWSGAFLRCNGRSPTKKELPPCFVGKNLTDITIDEFTGCPWNLAINRQTRMLADLRLVNCYNTKSMSVLKRRKVMLQSAMKNLQKMTYFALMEYQEESQYLFEKTFGLKFFTPFIQLTENETRGGKLLPELNNSALDQIRVLNSLDVELYSFAKNLFFERVTYFKETDRINNETRHF